MAFPAVALMAFAGLAVLAACLSAGDTIMERFASAQSLLQSVSR